MSRVPGVSEVLQQPLYDTNTIPAAGTALLSFFAVPQGQGQSQFGVAGLAKTAADTNMTLAAQLPSGYSFDLRGFRLAFPWNITQADISLALNAAVFEFIIGSKVFLQVPAQCVPAGNGPFGFFTQAAAANATVVNNGWPSMGNGFGIGRKPQVLESNMNFAVNLRWPSSVQAVTTTVTVQPAAGLPVRVYLDGELTRPAQ